MDILLALNGYHSMPVASGWAGQVVANHFFADPTCTWKYTASPI